MNAHRTASRRPLGRSGLEIAPLVFGANVFGWTVDEPTAFSLLDRFVDAGLNAIDTADVYSRWVPGNQGGESEAIIGNWLKRTPSRRDQVVLITKVGAAPGADGKGLSAASIASGVEASLRRLRTDRIDLYLSHRPDAATPIEETLRAYDSLVRTGKVRAIGSSNYTAEGLREALQVASAKRLPRYEVEEPEYSLCERTKFEGPLRDLCIAEGVGAIVYYSLASGFLSGKYRSKADLKGRARSGGVEKYLNGRGFRILAALDGVAGSHGAKPAEVALAWLIAREGVTAPIASATSLEQLESLVRATQLALSKDEIDSLTEASA
ncbi:MAG: aldo/keto reductase [Betaproteobacteria bacterium]|nr:aldo/keto reductase [Betaproteobacteria bacterium]